MRYLMQEQEYTAMFHSEETMWWYRGLRDVLIKNLQSITKKKIKILDAGCGTGKNIEFLRKLRYDVVGIDYSEKALSYCKKRSISSVKKASITKLPFPKNAFDVVICMDVVGILSPSDVKKACDEFYRVLKPGGVVILQAAAYMWLYSQHDVVTGVKKRYTRTTLEKYFLKEKWIMKKSSYRITFLFPLLAVTKIVKKLLHKNSHHAQTDQYVPPHFLNALLTAIQYGENKVFEKISLPFGSSVFLVVKKNRIGGGSGI